MKILSPAELKAEMDRLKISQTALSAATEISLTLINRYRKEHLQSLSVANLEKIAFVLDECAILAKIFHPIQLNFMDGDALVSTLAFSKQYRDDLQVSEEEEVNPFLSMCPEE
ncbi:MAG: helix-turn-helix domain-containing protein [Candidatus Acidiferrales bacterium]